MGKPIEQITNITIMIECYGNNDVTARHFSQI